MKKIATAVLAVVMVAGVAAPSFAQATLVNCTFKDASLCKVESIQSTNSED